MPTLGFRPKTNEFLSYGDVLRKHGKREKRDICQNCQGRKTVKNPIWGTDDFLFRTCPECKGKGWLSPK